MTFHGAGKCKKTWFVFIFIFTNKKPSLVSVKKIVHMSTLNKLEGMDDELLMEEEYQDTTTSRREQG